ncbi:MAG: Chromosome segregation protein SMC [uncultured Clostridium sp.]
MKNDDKINENQEIIVENSSEKALENEVNSFDLPQEDKNKIETKGLKLKKSTKERLNLLQSSFDDAESMVVALLNQYEVFKVESDDKFADRKGEIDRFNFLMESIKGCFVNSLEMATYIEDKCTEKMKGEIKKKDRVIALLQEENSSLNKKIKENEIEVKNKGRELEETKESFSRVNLALTTVEKELNEKSKVIENLQLHIASLSDISKENKAVKEENSKLREKIKLLESQLTEDKIELQRFEYLKRDNERYIAEISELRKEKDEYKVYSNELNNKIQEILLEKADEIAKLNNEKNQALRESEEMHAKELKESSNVISKLKDELYELKLTLNQLNTK